tara:strand:+ start:305 stop:574 length:270 start_codon:yes stop_codon:yes gene_type:complete
MTVDERIRLAGNRKTPPETLAELSRDQDERVRYWLAQNRKTPVETLVELSRDQNHQVRRSVATNPKWKRLEEAGILDQVIAASKYLGIL